MHQDEGAQLADRNDGRALGRAVQFDQRTAIVIEDAAGRARGPPRGRRNEQSGTLDPCARWRRSPSCR